MAKTYRFRYEYFLAIIISFAFTCIYFGCFFVQSADSCHAVSANFGNIVIEQSSGKILKGENINVRLPMASTTKIMTALVVIEQCNNLDKEFVIPDEATRVEGSSIYLKKGQKYTIRELLYGLMLRSGNDASVALAIATSGGVKEFVSLMNKRAEEIGLINTHFCNPNGLHDDNHYTTCLELATIARIAMNNPTFRQIVGSKSYEIGNTEEGTYQKLYNKNKFLTGFDGGCGIKTGYTKRSGRCLVAASERKGVTMISVVLNQADTYGISSSLIDYAFENYINR